ncbi:MAG: septal ring lytic transglycosylase RlpA family protein [Alphaproteobacteria bacterium]|nr:septal ring lytic transglycosylase RlpA family protein [Alphaproteobacteria bacterium]
MISTGAIAKTPGKGSSLHPGQLQGKFAKAEIWHGKARFPSCGADAHTRSRQAGSDSTESAGGPGDAYLGPVHTIGKSEIGRAAWYNWVGSRTASGEILDWVTPTAAHRSLPLASYAKVTNLDTGRAVVVKINDRGPYRRRFIIDLSPRAAEEIGVVRSGIAAVSVEPLAGGRASNSGTAPASETHVARAGSEVILYNSRPKNGAAPTTEAHAAGADSGAIPYNEPAWVDPRLERPASKDAAAPTTEAPVARADSGAIPYNQPAWVDPRLEQQ